MSTVAPGKRKKFFEESTNSFSNMVNMYGNHNYLHVTYDSLTL